MLNGNDSVIFAAMAGISTSFTAPANPGEYTAKHSEIEGILNFPDALSGRQVALNLMEAVGREVKNTGGVVGVSANDLITAIKFEGADGIVIRLTNDLRWATEWPISVHQGAVSTHTTVTLDVHDQSWGEVVPTYILECIHAAIALYRQGVNSIAVALLAIAVEATLRDVLAIRGYAFIKGASSVDIFGYSAARVAVDGNSYTLTFSDPMPRLPSTFATSAGAAFVDIQMKRVINARDRTIHLKAKAPAWFIDYWASDTLTRSAQKRVNGLGEAFHIARDVEAFLTPTMLPTDFDEVITVVRNNLIHLSSQALATPLLKLDSSGGYTLGQFLNDAFRVYDLMTNVPRFINDQYVDLRNGGHLV